MLIMLNIMILLMITWSKPVWLEEHSQKSQCHPLLFQRCRFRLRERWITLFWFFWFPSGTIDKSQNSITLQVDEVEPNLKSCSLTTKSDLHPGPDSIKMYSNLKAEATLAKWINSKFSCTGSSRPPPSPCCPASPGWCACPAQCGAWLGRGSGSLRCKPRRLEGIRCLTLWKRDPRAVQCLK